MFFCAFVRIFETNNFLNGLKQLLEMPSTFITTFKNFRNEQLFKPS